MKYYICLILTLSFGIVVCLNSTKNSYAQQKINSSKIALNDSLKKYTYLVIKVATDGAFAIGSGFFIKSNNKLFFISNYHVFANWDNIIGEQMKSKFNKVYIRIPNYGAYNTTINPDSLGKLCSSCKFYNQADIFSIVIKDLPSSVRINSIEKFINNDELPETNTELFSYGFGRPNNSKPPIKENIYSIGEKRSGSLKHPFQVFAKLDLRLIEKSKNHQIIDSLNYYSTIKAHNGDSGSPVFYKKNDKVIFGGVISSTSNIMQATIVVRPNKVLELIK